MARQKTRKQKTNPHYNFLYSWAPSESDVKREQQIAHKGQAMKLSASKKAEIQAKADSSIRIKKDILKSLILVSLVVILEIIVYLAWVKFLS